MRFSTLSAALLGLATTSLAMPTPKSAQFKRDVSGPVISTDFPDPSILKVGDTWYAFGTQSRYNYTQVKTQLATSSDFNTWDLQEDYDALRNLPSWVNADNPQVWAPDIFQVDDGSFVMYFSATTKANGQFHCVGAATSSSIEGPYDSVSDTPLVCPTELGGAIDASAFRDADGSRYILYKDDGNAIGHGGSCNNANDPQVDTWIVLQKVAENGYDLVGAATRLINRDPSDGPLVEAPALVREPGGTYILYFSSQCYTGENYDTSYATSKRIDGDYQKAQYPLLVTGTVNVWGPGGADVDWDGTHMAFHGYETKAAVGGVRSMFVARATYNDGSNTVTVL